MTVLATVGGLDDRLLDWSDILSRGQSTGARRDGHGLVRVIHSTMLVLSAYVMQSGHINFFTFEQRHIFLAGLKRETLWLAPACAECPITSDGGGSEALCRYRVRAAC